MNDLDNHDDNYHFVDDDNIEKLETLEHYLKSLIEIITNQSEPMILLLEEKIST